LAPIDVGDFQQIRDDGTGSGTARDAGDTLAAAIADEIADDQEVTDETGLLDDLEFDFEAVEDSFDAGSHQRIVGLEFGAGRNPGKFSRILNAMHDKLLALSGSVHGIARVQSLCQ
jgi:hypothetical protein